MRAGAALPAVVALLADASCERGLAAGFEEEGVPLLVSHEAGSRGELARRAAAQSPLGLGIGSDPHGIVLVLAAAPSRPYLEASHAEARELGHAAARIAARRAPGASVAGS